MFHYTIGRDPKSTLPTTANQSLTGSPPLLTVQVGHNAGALGPPEDDAIGFPQGDFVWWLWLNRFVREINEDGKVEISGRELR